MLFASCSGFGSSHRCLLLTFGFFNLLFEQVNEVSSLPSRNRFYILRGKVGVFLQYIDFLHHHLFILSR